MKVGRVRVIVERVTGLKISKVRLFIGEKNAVSVHQKRESVTRDLT